MKKKVAGLFIGSLLIFLAGISFSKLTTWVQDRKGLYLSGDYLVYSENNPKILGTNNQNATIDVDFSHVQASGSPYVFGGSQSPTSSQTDAWNKLQSVGVTGIRKDFFLEYSVPTTSVSDYLANKNNVTNINNWRLNNIDENKNIFSEAKSLGMQTTGILSYAPPWLTYNGNAHGVPKNWTIYEDILKKLYTKYRDQLDNLEVWNEPNYKYFFDPSGSGMTKEQAYIQIFLHATDAIRQVDNLINDGKHIKIGGPVSYRIDDLTMAEMLLQNPDTRKQLDFLSLHYYGSQLPDLSPWRNLLHKYNDDSLPIAVTEWNYTPDVTNNLPQLTGPEAIPYTGGMLMNFLSQGVQQANYYSLFPVDYTSQVSGHGFLAFFSWNQNKATLLPQANTWQLLSQTMGLGKGNSVIYGSNISGDIVGLSFKNVSGNLGFAMTNPDEDQKIVTVNLHNLPLSGYVDLKAYRAINNGDASSEVSETVLPVNNGSITTNILEPANSVVGVLLTSSDVVQYKADSLLHSYYTQ